MTKFRSLVLLQMKDVNALPTTPIESVTKTPMWARMMVQAFHTISHLR